MRSRNLLVLTSETQARYPGVVIYGIGDEEHKLRVSDHNEDDTAGSLAAQSDADTTPEHRAIDIMLGPAFSRVQADALIQRLLAEERRRMQQGQRSRLAYIIFAGRIWSRSNGWVEQPRTSDPHNDHIHISGWAPDDENAAPWLTGATMADDYNPYPRPATIGDRPLAVLIADIWGQVYLGGSPWDGAKAALPKQLDRVEAKLDRLPVPVPAQVDVAALVAALRPELRELVREVVRAEIDAVRYAPTRSTS